MRETRTLGSVEGAPGDLRLYSDITILRSAWSRWLDPVDHELDLHFFSSVNIARISGACGRLSWSCSDRFSANAASSVRPSL